MTKCASCFPPAVLDRARGVCVGGSATGVPLNVPTCMGTDPLCAVCAFDDLTRCLRCKVPFFEPNPATGRVRMDECAPRGCGTAR